MALRPIVFMPPPQAKHCSTAPTDACCSAVVSQPRVVTPATMPAAARLSRLQTRESPTEVKPQSLVVLCLTQTPYVACQRIKSMNAKIATMESTDRRITEIFDEHQQDICKRTDRMFAVLMALQWVAGVVAAYWISP